MVAGAPRPRHGVAPVRGDARTGGPPRRRLAGRSLAPASTGVRVAFGLVFVISPPRAGSTLLTRVLHAMPEVLGGPEPHIIPPLAHQGWWRPVHAAPYDPLRAARGQRAFVSRLPAGEADYLAACRAMTDHLYARLRDAERPSARLVVDKTPQHALCLPFLTRLYPDARYLVLTRHPAAIASSYARSFFAGDHRAARRHDPILERYIPPIARLLRERPVALLHLTHESFVTRPEVELRRICDFLGVPVHPEALDYQRAAVPPGPGDPTGVGRHRRPVADGLDAWVHDLARPAAFAEVRAQLDVLADEDLETWGTPRAGLWDALHRAGQLPPPRPLPVRHALRRWLLVTLRRDIDHRPHGRLVRAVHEASAVLLRGAS
ncbi:MAG: sulfotransferase [Deltaproteobacteria bacterium]|nr:MAG: sulfotransferase [Deltaproteobacteria bacterium]